MEEQEYCSFEYQLADLGGRAVCGLLRPLACWNCGFESRRGLGLYLSCECCVLSDRGICDWPIPRSEESYRGVSATLRVSWYSSNDLHLQSGGKRGQALKNISGRVETGLDFTSAFAPYLLDRLTTLATG